MPAAEIAKKSKLQRTPEHILMRRQRENVRAIGGRKLHSAFSHIIRCMSIPQDQARRFTQACANKVIALVAAPSYPNHVHSAMFPHLRWKLLALMLLLMALCYSSRSPLVLSKAVFRVASA